MIETDIHIRPFHDLDALTWHDIAALRSEVFVVEQDCVYQDLDGKDPIAYHLYWYDGKLLVATLRILKKGEGYPDAVAIGRVVSSPERRSQGLGHVIMKAALDFIAKEFPEELIRLSAQTHLSAFYERHGFQVSGEGYLEDGIPHVPMLRQNSLHS
ncbi:MAG: GNAT family N-acetyltransferase [Bacteroidetes bacterium]|nr:GNAT family N-acetyltransferase [Bacteroidota bacterium]